MRIVIDLVNDSPEDPAPTLEEAVERPLPPLERLELTIEETEPPPPREE